MKAWENTLTWKAWSLSVHQLECFAPITSKCQSNSAAKTERGGGGVFSYKGLEWKRGGQFVISVKAMCLSHFGSSLSIIWSGETVRPMLCAIFKKTLWLSNINLIFLLWKVGQCINNMVVGRHSLGLQTF